MSQIQVGSLNLFRSSMELLPVLVYTSKLKSRSEL